MQVHRNAFTRMIDTFQHRSCPIFKEDYYETFELAPLPYAYDYLEPVIDAETMKLHHDKTRHI